MKLNWKRLIAIIVITFIVGNFFSLFIINNMDTFKELEKPLNVPTLLFPIVWSILYVLMGISCYIVYQSNNKNRSIALLSYIIQLIINSLWSLIFLDLKPIFFHQYG